MNSKLQLRRRVYDARKAQLEKDGLSRRAVQRILECPAYQNARTIMWYVDCRSELRTQWVLSDLIQSGKSIVVPFCTTGAAGENCLGLWRIECLEELVVGKWKILEPPESSWFEPERVVKAMELDFVVVPGVAFTRNGSRLGNGQGYYDRLLSTVGPDCTLAGLCFECQIVDDAEMVSEPHDVSMHMVATEKELYLSTS